MFALLLASVLLVLADARWQTRRVNMRMASTQNRVQGADRLDVAAPETWRPYLIEWRGIEPTLRMDELTDALSIVLAEERRGNGQVQVQGHEVVMLSIQDVVADSLSSLPVLGYCLLPPSDRAIAEVCRRCSTIRSITEVYVDTGGGWSDGISSTTSTTSTTSSESESESGTVSRVDMEMHMEWGAAITPEQCVADGRFEAAILSAFVPRSQGQGQREGEGEGEGGAIDNSWRVDFRRYGRAGRSGLSYGDKAALLRHFDPLFRRLNDHPDVENFHGATHTRPTHIHTHTPHATPCRAPSVTICTPVNTTLPRVDLS